jgi:hypothetical protein
MEPRCLTVKWTPRYIMFAIVLALQVALAMPSPVENTVSRTPTGKQPSVPATATAEVGEGRDIKSKVTLTSGPTQGLGLRPMAAKLETGEANCDPKSNPVAHESEVKVGKENIDLN